MKTAALVCLVALTIFGTKAQADVKRFQFQNRTNSLTVEILNDRIIHFELAPNASRSNLSSPLPHTPYIIKEDFQGPESYLNRSNVVETEELTLSFDQNRLCVSVFDKRAKAQLTTICPLADGGLTMASPSMTDVYGLGEQFSSLGETNGNWDGQVRSSPGEFGNALVPFGGGSIANAQFPIMYAVGKNRHGTFKPRRGRCKPPAPF
jgi:hypothetical protein